MVAIKLFPILCRQIAGLGDLPATGSPYQQTALNIDASLIRNLHEDHTAFLVTSGIVQLARSLNIRSIAGFFHNETVQERVRELGIDFSQGDYFGTPEALL